VWYFPEWRVQHSGRTILSHFRLSTWVWMGSNHVRRSSLIRASGFNILPGGPIVWSCQPSILVFGWSCFQQPKTLSSYNTLSLCRLVLGASCALPTGVTKQTQPARSEKPDTFLSPSGRQQRKAWTFSNRSALYFFPHAFTNKTGWSYHHVGLLARRRVFFFASLYIGSTGFPAAIGFLHFWMEYLLNNQKVF